MLSKEKIALRTTIPKTPPNLIQSLTPGNTPTSTNQSRTVPEK